MLVFLIRLLIRFGKMFRNVSPEDPGANGLGSHLLHPGGENSEVQELRFGYGSDKDFAPPTGFEA